MPIDFLDGVTIDIEKIPSYSEIINATFKEKIDKQICEIILHSDNPLITNEMKEDFKNKVVDNLDEKGILEHRYYQQNNLGRFLVKNDTSLTSQHSDKYIGFTLYKYMKWMNLDTKTSGLSIICEVMKPFEKKIPIINLMRNDFDGFVETIRKYYQKIGILDRRRIKKLVYRFFYYDNFSLSIWVNYLQNKNIYIKNSKKIHPLISAYIKEFKFVRKVIYENNSQIAFYLQDKKTLHSLVLESCRPEKITSKDNIIRLWCYIIETEIMSCVYNFITKENIIKNNYCTIFGDAIVFPYVERDKDEVIKKLNKYVKTKTGFKFQLDFKSLAEEQFVLEEIIEERKQYQNDYMEDDDADEYDADDNEDKEEDDDKAVNPWNDMDAIYKHPIGKGTIFVGNKIASENLTLLKQLKVTRVINCTFDNLNVPNFHEKHFKYYNFAIRNWNKYITSANSKILEFIYPVFRFIDPAIEKGENVLIHCFSGSHRSGTLAIASLMYYENLDVATAISKAKTLRPIINPTGNLKKFLYKFEFDKNHKNGSMNYEDDDEDEEDDDEEEDDNDSDFN